MRRRFFQIRLMVWIADGQNSNSDPMRDLISLAYVIGIHRDFLLIIQLWTLVENNYNLDCVDYSCERNLAYMLLDSSFNIDRFLKMNSKESLIPKHSEL